MENEIAVSGQLGIEDKKAPIEQPELPKTSGESPQYRVHQQYTSSPTGLLPSTGELRQAGGFMMILFCLTLVLILMFRMRQKLRVSAEV